MPIPMNTPRTWIRIASAVALLLAARLSADVVETKNGARIVGEVVKIGDGSIVMKTEFAGDVVIKQSLVTSISTEKPVSVRLASGTVFQGTLSSDGGAVKINGADGQLTTNVEKVAATWAAGEEDPAVTALRRHWAYEAAVDVTGKTGNREQLGTAVSARATLKTAQDTLQFYTAYDRQVADGAKSADQFKAGVDYQNNFSGKKSWYVRDEGGFDGGRLLERDRQCPGRFVDRTDLHVDDVLGGHPRDSGRPDVIDADRVVLQQKRAAVQLDGDRAQTVVELIRAIGGGWGA